MGGHKGTTKQAILALKQTLFLWMVSGWVRWPGLSHCQPLLQFDAGVSVTQPASEFGNRSIGAVGIHRRFRQGVGGSSCLKVGAPKWRNGSFWFPFKTTTRRAKYPQRKPSPLQCPRFCWLPLGTFRWHVINDQLESIFFVGLNCVPGVSMTLKKWGHYPR